MPIVLPLSAQDVCGICSPNSATLGISFNNFTTIFNFFTIILTADDVVGKQRNLEIRF